MPSLYRPPDIPKVVSSIKFQLCNEADIKQFSHVQVLKCLLYGEGQNNRKALEYGLLDPKLGANKRDELCATCGLDYQICIGHWGYFDLPVPIFHVGYSWHIVKILQCICKTCSRVLLPEAQRDRFLSSCSNPNLEYIQKKQLRKAVHKLASKVHVCPYCSSINGFVTKGANLSHVLHDVYRYAKSKVDEYVEEYTAVIAENPELGALLRKGLDDLTQMYQWILAQAATIEDEITETDQVACLDNLHAEFARLINSQQSGLPPVQDHKFMRGLLQRLSGKHGRFRGNLLGKRTNYTARTVISPDPNMRIDEVIVPDHCAKLLTYPARVTTFNLEFLRELILNGPNCYPGALFVSYKLRGEQKRKAEAEGGSDVIKRFLASARAREDVARHLQPGDIVERHLIDGDIILFNRQPSLHRVSIQAFKAVVKPFRTFRFNPSCCNPFNADFDGDEMNVHLPQTEAARSEAKHLIFATCDDYIRQYEKNSLKCNPGCSMEDTLESNLSQELSKIRDEAGAACKRQLHPSNSPLVMAQCGSKGSFLNISQMIACVGQQVIGGKRVPDVINGRSLIHFPRGSRTPEAKGFVGNSFYSGLTPSEFFFHAMSGREGLTDTAVKTADTGYMQRRLVKFLEDLAVAYDNTVRDSRGDIIQFCYGSDGLDPLEMETDKFPVDLVKELANIRTSLPCRDEEPMSPDQIDLAIRTAFTLDAFKTMGPIVESEIKVSRSSVFGRLSSRCVVGCHSIRLITTFFCAQFLEDLAVAYDNTVRDSRGDIIQFCYGSDGLDPLEMETDKFPVDLVKELANIRTSLPCRDEEPMSPDQIDLAIRTAFTLDAFKTMGPIVESEIKKFFTNTVCPRLRNWQRFCQSHPTFWTAGCTDASGERLTCTQLRLFLTRVKEKYERALIEPGTAVGALCGQSVGEPATQMTLKTFHFAGVASMNITQGVPRMREIVNAAAKIKTPLITVTLTDPFSASLARQVKLAIEPTRLADISVCLRQCLTPEDVYVAVKLDEKRMTRRGITTARVATAVQQAKLRKVKLSRVTYSTNFVYVYPVDLNTLETVVKVLEDVVVKGIPGVARVVIQQDKDCVHRIYVEGAKLREVCYLRPQEKAHVV
ncbi:hypothetical protein AHF37_05549 [Paragonimus kellicotti]|nr:hypothetical protein AHF37_05549 [Paragonimus kellicotti]